MNEHTILLVKESFDLVEPIATRAGTLFYTNLFEADPSLRPLFKGDIDAQAAKLMQMIAIAVAELSRPEQLMPVLKRLGQRHAGYGVRDADYDTVGGALLKTLRQGLGVAFTEDVEAAWTEVYGVLATTMKEAASVTA